MAATYYSQRKKKNYIYQPGPCRGCNRVNADERGINLCELNGLPCHKINPGRDCGSRIVNKWEDAVPDRTGEVIRNAKRCIAESNRLMEELEELRRKRREK